MTPEEVDRLAKKWQDGTISTEDRARFEHWYRSFDDAKLYIDSNEGEAAMKSRIYQGIAAAGKITEVQRPGGRPLWWRYSAAAAVLLVLFLFYWNRQNAFKDRPWIAHIHVDAGTSVKQEILPDGSIIWLRPGASLHYIKAFKNRDVDLTGEALFEVSKIAGRPFKVHVGDYMATVLGTSFNIRQADNSKDMEVVVLTGKVAISRQRERSEQDVQQAGQTVVLTPNQRLQTKNGLKLEMPIVETVELPQNNEYTQGTAYNMWMDDTPFEQVARRITTKFGVAIEVEDDRYSNCRISANLNDQSLEYTAELVAAALGATYEIQKNKIMLKGGGCL